MAIPDPPITTRPPRREYEVKFPVPQARVPLLIQWLAAHCRPHPEYPGAEISSVYYDTPDWELLNEKVNSDYFKAKVRLRWYRVGAATSRAWMEAKIKEGSRRLKLRCATEHEGERLLSTPLDSPLYTGALAALREKTAFANRLTPVYQITYRRLRFCHRFSPSVFCLDHAITIPRVHPGRMRLHRPDPLPWAVLEQKGPLEELDPLLGGAHYFRLQKRAFSKYMSAYFWLMNQPH